MKFRVVFNASAQSTNGVSLNDTQHNGPTIQDRLANIILRFRRYEVAVVADVEKMFRQVQVAAEHQPWQSIVWRENPTEELKTYRLTTVTYGTRSGPYLAVRTLVQCARDNYAVIKNIDLANQALQSIEQDFYVDDYLSSSPTRADSIRLSRNVDGILQQGHFRLRKWKSNDLSVVQAIRGENESGKSPLPIDSTEISVLGLQWDSETDTLSFDITLTETTTFTKRTILSDVSKLFDPTGMLAPVVIVAKIFIQKLWLAGIGWDEPIPNELLREWTLFRKDLFKLVDIEFPRCIGLDPNRCVTLHGFCDASSRAYAAVIYVRTVDENGMANVRLITSKTKVAPVRTMSIPRLELCGAQLLVNTINSVRQALSLEHVEYYLWTDSTIVLAWLRRLPVRLKVYVANRVSYIQQYSEPTSWRHVPTIENPADCASRGIGAVELRNHSLWWAGPEFLQTGDLLINNEEPIQSSIEQEVIRTEEKSMVVAHGLVRDDSRKVFIGRPDGRRYNLLDFTNSIVKLKRIVASLLYAGRRQREATRGEDICSADRLQQSMLAITRLDQDQCFRREMESCRKNTALPADSVLHPWNPFIDDDGILRLGGRISRATMDTAQIHPIILAKESRLAAMVIWEVHQSTAHGGVQLMLQTIRRTYWIIGGRALVKSLIHKCIICSRQRGIPVQQKMGELPFHRVNRQHPFETSGIDYFGPFILRLGEKRSRKTIKTYVAIFVCMATKAVHMELAADLSANAFLDAFSRFNNRRGPCTTLYSDNATNFHGANRIMKEDLQAWHSEHNRQQLVNKGVKWIFITPAAPHQGGIWEAAVKSAKKHIVRVVGDQIMSYEQLNTLIIRVEACLNSRPIVALHDDPEDKLALTPADFLSGGRVVALPEPSVAHLPLNRVQEWHLVRRWTEEIWRRWQDEYLQSLQRRSKWTRATDSVKVNDIVVVRHENLPPTRWLLGRVIETHPGEDNLVRVVTLQHFDVETNRRFTSTRPIQKLCILYSEEDSETKVSEEAGMSESVPTTHARDA